MSDNSNIVKALTMCQGKNREEILNRAFKLNAAQRIALISYFDIEPHHLGAKIVQFWTWITRTNTTVSEGVGSFFAD